VLGIKASFTIAGFHRTLRISIIVYKSVITLDTSHGIDDSSSSVSSITQKSVRSAIDQ